MDDKVSTMTETPRPVSPRALCLVAFHKRKAQVTMLRDAIASDIAGLLDLAEGCDTALDHIECAIDSLSDVTDDR